MDKEIEKAISELSEDVNNFIKNSDETHRKVKYIMKNEAGTMPLSERLSGDTYKKSNFSDYIRHGVDHFLTKSMSDKTGESGGHLIPQEIALHINEKLKNLSPVRAISRSITISTSSVDILVDSKLPEAGWAASTDETRNETGSPEIKKIKIPVHEIFAKPIASQKLLDDSQINVEEWLIGKVSEKIAALENSAFVNGDGNNKPHGFLQCESSADEKRDFGKLQHFCTGVKGNFETGDKGVDILIDIVCSIKPIYVKKAKWIMSRAALAKVRKLKNKDGAYLWQPSTSESCPSTLLGYPVIIDDDMPGITEGTESTPIAFGDFYSGYQIVDRQGLQILRDPYTSKPFVEFYASKRTGGEVVDFDAIKLLKFAEKSE
ncbi:MAG: phage major capsid protein [Holosporaceae bacterium]|jgi:HK97 family phage major capsid protein|nr:phage major capsid protein [Holosporaceae bacterium]